MEIIKKVRFLYLAPGPATPHTDPSKNKFHHLSRYFSGDVLAPVWSEKKNPEINKTIEEAREAMGNFGYHVTFSTRLPRIIKILWDINFYLFKGLYLHYFKEKYDLIVTYGPFKTALSGYLLKLFTGAKLIVDFPGNPHKSFLLEEKKPTKIDLLISRFNEFFIPYLIKRADHIKLLYPGQLDGYKSFENKEHTTFHDLVAINSLVPSQETDMYILSMGHPWYLKGFDILIKAFKSISDEYRDFSLKIVGFCPDKSYFEKIAGDSSKIELLDAVSHEEAIKLLSKCALYVLPSRTEGIAKVLLEAMALRRPIVASKVDGVPYCIRDGHNGLLFESENVDDLAEKMRVALGDYDYAKQLAEHGYEDVQKFFTEECYVEKFYSMVEKTLRKG